MYKSAVILVALIGTACAFPPADILRKSVAEDNVDEKAPEIPPQGSEVENQKEDDGVRESDKESTSEYRLFTATMKIPEFTTVTAIRSDQSAEENEEPKTSCAEGDASCDSLDENTPRQKRTIRMFPWDQIPHLSMNTVKVSYMDNIPDFKGFNIPDSSDFDFTNIPGSDVKIFKMPDDAGIQIGNIPDIQIPNLSQIDLSNLAKVQVKTVDVPGLQNIQMPNDFFDGNGLVGIIINGGEATNGLPGSCSGDGEVGETNDEALEKLQEEVQALTKKLQEAEKNLALKDLAIKENTEKTEQGYKALQEKHDAEVKVLTEKLDGLKEELEQQSRKSNETLNEVKKSCEQTLNENKEREDRERETLQEAHNTEVKILKEKLVDLREELDQRSGNFTTTVEEGKKSCEKTLNENKEREDRERETLQEAHNTEVKILKEKLVDLREELDQRSGNFTTTVEEGKKSCEKTLNENKEREDRERETLQEAHNTEVKILKEKLVDLREELDQRSGNFPTTLEEGKKSCETPQTDHAAEIESMKEMVRKEKQISIGLNEKLNTQATEYIQNLKAQKERWDNRLTEQTERSKKELAKITELHEICVAHKEKKDKQIKELQSFERKVGIPVIS
ncbi:serine/threonine-protein kinase MRCK alpha-like [Neodiprion fabricii]|uniref:serine/threonine-protein kinase MRCK alpha-like n=1 Tax=Neodiprion fabricii TaxID=2872261 RepID=UPI001ED96189|nr:serine/threonine-protein kinase MRCK alpha-like [Neodiprion fabricii]